MERKLSRQERRALERKQANDLKRARRRQRAVASGAVLGVGASMVAPGAARADVQANATFTVTSLADDDSGGLTLREAVNLANDTEEADTIRFQTGLTGTITLTGERLTLTNPVTIDGPGSNAITIDADGASSAFYIWSNEYEAQHQQYSISGLSITNGSDSWGGAIASWGEHLTLDDVVVTGNQATRGGAVYFYGNGGATELVITDSEISGNVADQTGGGVYVEAAADVSIRYTRFYDNVAGASGGGLYGIENEHVEFFEVEFDSNDATDAGGGAGVDMAYEASVSITRSTFSNNDADGRGGGAVFLLHSDTDDADAPTSLEITDSMFTQNDSGARGGGLYLYGDNGTLAISSSTISGNTSAFGGAGIYAGGSKIRITDGTTLHANDAAAGYGGGLYAHVPRNVYIADSVVSANETGGSGAGIALGSASFRTDIVRTTITGNVALSEGDGGGIHAGIDTYGSFYLMDSEVTGNSAAGSGGGLYLYGPGEDPSTSDARIEGTEISGNDAAGNGGGVAASGVTVQFTQSEVLENTSNQYGGGARIYNAIGYVYDTTFDGNHADDQGGGLALDDVEGMVVESTISGNTTDGSGGGFSAQGETVAYLYNTTITENDALDGGGVHITGADGYFGIAGSFLTIADNAAAGQGGNVYVTGGGFADLIARHAIISGGTAGESGQDLGGDGGVFLAWSLVEDTDDADTVTLVDYGAGHGVAPSEHSTLLTGVDPMLGDLEDNGGETLTREPAASSPAVDAGDPEFSEDDDPETDQRGEARVYNDRVDMGAVEYHPSTTGGGGSGSDDDDDDDDGTISGPGRPETLSVPPAGDDGTSTVTFTTSDGRELTVVVVGATEDTVVTVTERTVESVDDAGGTTLITVYDVEVEGGAESAEICLPYSDEDAADLDEGDLQLFHFLEDGGREIITTERDTDTNEVCGTTDSFSPFAIGVMDTERLAGVTSIDTAVAISEATFPDGANTVFVATRGGFADVLGAGPAAAAAGAPILLTNPNALAAATSAEIERLGAERIVVVGGTDAISDAVAAELAMVGTVERVAGTDRYETAVALSEATFEPGVDVVYVATGVAFPDGLVAGAAAAAQGGAPVLLTDGETLSAATRAELERLAPGSIVVVGGTAAVAASVEDALGSFTTGTVTRLAGIDRYATAAAVAATFPAGSPAFVATGLAPWDALTGVPAAAAANAALLLTSPDALHPDAADALTALQPPAITVLGGTAAITLDTELDIADQIVE